MPQVKVIMLHTRNHNLGLKTPTGKKAGQKASYTSKTGQADEWNSGPPGFGSAP